MEKERDKEKKNLTAAKVAEIATKLVGLLDSLAPEDRRKVIHASLTMLGDDSAMAPASHEGQGSPSGGRGAGDLAEGLPARAATWARQNQITKAELEDIFDLDAGNASVIAASAPGGNKREQTKNAYVLQGLSRLLATGESAFDDDSARKLCESLGCYDSANHSVNIKKIGNVLTGSKSAGWKLTAPGLRHAATLVKGLSKGD